MLVFGLLEVARAMYVVNTLHEVTRRAAALAANSGFDQASQDEVRRKALFPDADGNLILGRPITPSHLRIDYMSLARDASSGTLTPVPMSAMPSCPAKNKINCVADPYSPSCIRLVQVRICQPGTDCTRVPYEMLFPLVNLPFLLPRAETITAAQTMGYTLGSIPCP